MDADDNDKDSDDRDPDEDSEDDDEENDDYEKINFASPDFDTNELKLSPNLNNDTYIWVILWVLQYQQRYKLSNIALFKFLRFTLSTIDASKFSSFPSSLYMAKKVGNTYGSDSIFGL